MEKSVGSGDYRKCPECDQIIYSSVTDLGDWICPNPKCNAIVSKDCIIKEENKVIQK